MAEVITAQPGGPDAAPPTARAPDRARGAALPDLRGHLPSLDGLRGLAIALVMLGHFLPEEGHPHSLAGRVLFFVGRAGWTGVDLFFVLSGFLITGILLDSRGTGAGRYFRNFYARRTLRIFPLYYGVLAVIFLVIPLINPHAFDSPELMRVRHEQGWVWAYCTNIKIARVVTGGSMAFYADWLELNAFWSLAIEEQFYVVWPAVVYFLGNRALLTLCAILMAGGALTRALMIQKGMDPWATYVFTPCRVDSLAIGAAVAILLRQGGPAARLVSAHAGKVAVVFGAASVAWLAVKHGKMVDAVLRYPLVGVCAAALLVRSLTAPPKSWLGRPFHSRVLRTLGKYSYGLYVYHVILLGSFDRFFGQPDVEGYYRHRLHLGHAAYGLSVLTYAGLAFIISFAIAFASWHLYERQFLRLKRYFEYGGKGRRASAPGATGMAAST